MAACRVLSSLKTKQLNLHNKLMLPSSSIKRLYSETWEPKEARTHTGQVWEKDDYRLVRFIDRPKQINTQFAVDLIDTVPPAAKKERVVSCDGGGGPTGHPRVYINLDQPGSHACGYCGLRFVKEDH